MINSILISICLSDFHYDNTQKYVRAGIINEILASRKNTYKEVIFLIEGTQAGQVPDHWCYNKLVGDNLINSHHYVVGWDNMKLNCIGIGLIKNIQKSPLEGKDIERSYAILNKKKSEILRNINISAETIFNLVEGVETEMKQLSLQGKTISARIDSLLDEINNIADKRDDYLQKSINKVIENQPIVFVIGGKNHFKHISSVINNLSHCILNLKEIRQVTDFDEALTEVY